MEELWLKISVLHRADLELYEVFISVIGGSQSVCIRIPEKERYTRRQLIDRYLINAMCNLIPDAPSSRRYWRDFPWDPLVKSLPEAVKC